MSTNLGQLRDRVKRNLDRRQITTEESDQITVWVNQVIREDICADHHWASMEAMYEINTTADVDLYAFPSPDRFKDCLAIWVQSETDGEFSELEELAERELLRDYSDTTTGTPKVWSRSGEGFRLRYVPSTSDFRLRLRVWEYPDELTEDSSTNTFLQRWSKLVEFGVTARACLYWGESPQTAQLWTQMYRDELGKAVAVDRRRLSPSTLILKPSSYAGYPASSRRGRRRW